MADIVDDMIQRWAPDNVWRLAQPLNPVQAMRPQGGGKRRADDRAVLAAIMYMSPGRVFLAEAARGVFGVSRPRCTSVQ